MRENGMDIFLLKKMTYFFPSVYITLTQSIPSIFHIIELKQASYAFGVSVLWSHNPVSYPP